MKVADGRAGIRSMARTQLMHAPRQTGVLRGNVALVVAPIIVGVLVLYGSLIPFRFSGAHFAQSARLPHFGFVLSPTTVEDCLVNVLVYAIFGLTMAFCLTRRGRSVVRTIVATSLVGTVVSLCVELLQLGLSARVSSGFDIALNIAGMVLGASLGVGLAHTLHMPRLQSLVRLPSANWRGVSIILAVGLLLYHLSPFQFVTTTDQLHRSLERAIVGFGASGSISPWSILGHLPHALWFALFGWCVYQAASSRDRSLRFAFAAAAAQASVLVVTISAMQLLTTSHTPRLSSVCMFAGAALIGATMGPLARFAPHILSATSRVPVRLNVIAPTLLILLEMAAMVGTPGASPGNGMAHASVGGVHLIPFELLWRQPMTQALTSFVADCAAYLALAVTVMWVLFRLRTAVRNGAVLAVCVAAAGVELAFRSATRDQGGDMTIMLIAVFAAFCVTYVSSMRQEFIRRTAVSERAPASRLRTSDIPSNTA